MPVPEPLQQIAFSLAVESDEHSCSAATMQGLMDTCPDLQDLTVLVKLIISVSNAAPLV